MINKIYRTMFVFGLLLVFIILGTNQSYASTKILQPKIYQHLDIGVVFGHQGKAWSNEKYVVGGNYRVIKSIEMGSEIELVGAYPLVGNEGRFDFNDGDTCTHNILPKYSFPVHYAPYSATLSNISARAEFNKINWSYNATLVASKKMGVVDIVNNYKGIPNGLDYARRDIYGPLGGEDVVKNLYFDNYESIEETIKKAAMYDFKDRDVILYFCPIVFKYQKYVEVDDIVADLDIPTSVNKHESYSIKDASKIDQNLLVSEGVLEKKIDGSWQQIAKWQGNGKFGENTCGQSEQYADEEGEEEYKFTIRTTTGQEATCTKTVIVIGDVLADLDIPANVKKGTSYSIKDASKIDKTLVVSEGVLEKKINGKWQQIAKWQGSGKSGENTGGRIEQQGEKEGSEEYKFTIRSTSGKESTCTKTVVIKDERKVDGKAELMAPLSSYEGHEFSVLDVSQLSIDGKNVHPQTAYDEGLAKNYYHTAADKIVRDKKDAKMTFFRRGNYAITLEVRLKNGKSLYDTKNVEIIKTPCAEVGIGGIQKQNRKQVFSASIVTSPEFPVVEYELEIRDSLTAEVAKISDKNPVYVGSGIKTRTAQLVKQNEYFTTLNLEFLTKFPNYFETGKEERRFEYYLKVRDAKNDVDIRRGSFLVRPDLPPNVQIAIQDAFLRSEGSNFAKIFAEDVSLSDGDKVERKWEYMDLNGELSNGEDGFENIDNYFDISLGARQKISWEKEGVGKFKVRLKVKEEWIEETLQEFIEESDYLSGEGEASSDVLNIAPKVSVTPLESKEIDLVLIGTEEELSAAKKQENTFQAKLIESGIDANISYVRFRKQKEGARPYEKFADKTYSAGVGNTLSDSIYMLSDMDYFYNLKCGIYINDRGIHVGKNPYEIVARDAITGNQVWSFVVNEEGCRAYTSENGKYFCISVGNLRTKLLDRKTGQYIGEIPICVKGKVFTDKRGERIYIAGEDGISLYNIVGNRLKKVAVGEIYFPHLQNGKLTFIHKKGQLEFYYATLDLETEELLEVEYSDLANSLNYRHVGEKTEYAELKPVCVDTRGNAIFSSVKYVRSYEYISHGSWYVELENQSVRKIFEKEIEDDDVLIDVGGILNEKGEIINFYYNYFEYDNANNRGYGFANIHILKYASEQMIYNKSRTKRDEDAEIILAQKDGKRDCIYIVKAGKSDPYMLLGSVTIELKSETYEKMNDESFADYILHIPENYIEQDDFALFGTWINRYTTDMKHMRTNSLPLSNSQLLNKIIKKRVNFRNGVGRYVMALNGDVKALLEMGVNVNKEVNIPEKTSLEEVHEEIADLEGRAVGMLLLKGGKDGSEAKVRSSSILNINDRYNYEYIMYKNSENASDILKIANETSNNIYEKVIEKQEFTVPYKEGFIKFNGTMIGGIKGSEYKGFGAKARKRWKSVDCSIEFTMEKEGYAYMNIFVKGGGRRSFFDVYDNGARVFGEMRFEDGIKSKEIKLSKGKHIIKFEVYTDSKGRCEIGLKSIEIGYFENKKPLSHSSEVYKIGNGKFLVKGGFNAVNRYAAFELSNKSEENIKISNFKLYGESDGKTAKCELYNEEFSDKDKCKKWNFIEENESVAQIVKSKRQIGEMEGELVYKKGQLVRYKLNYKDYEEDPSKKEYWLYVHTPYNDGSHPKAFAIKNLDGSIKEIRGGENSQLGVKELVELAEKNGAFIYEKPIDKFYIDGKYTVYHWQEDDTSRGKLALGNSDYDKKSNICEITFYIEGTSNAPYVKSIITSPVEVEAGKSFSINVEIDDLEKESLSLITEVYKKGKLIFTHKKDNILPNSDGIYPVINTGIVSQKAQKGLYKVVCTVSDGNSVGTGKYQFLVKELKDLKAKVKHTKKWEENRKKYNENICETTFDRNTTLKKYVKQKKPRPRAANVFWAGESFVLAADVLGDVSKVSCKIEGTKYNVNMKQVSEVGDKKIFSGKLWENSMKKEWAGKEAFDLTFVFTATYEDGEILEFTQDVIVDDSVSFRKLHRKW